jgi:hypothetical protein
MTPVKNLRLTYITDILPSAKNSEMASRSKNLAANTISLGFASLVMWDLKVLTEDTVDWLNGSMKISGTSKVGTLSTLEFSKLPEPSFDQESRSDFQRMMYADSLSEIRVFNDLLLSLESDFKLFYEVISKVKIIS